MKYLNYTTYNSKTKDIKIIQMSDDRCLCDLVKNLIFNNQFCIPNELLKDYQNYDNFKLNSNYVDLKFLTFFCQILKNTTSCNHLANLCVLSDYNLDRNSPCSLFYTTQTDDLNGNDDFSKIRPFLFYKKGKSSSEMLQKTVDFSYHLRNDANNLINLTLVSFRLNGILDKFKFLEINDLNLCAKYGSKNKYIRFGENLEETCEINGRELDQRFYGEMKFFTIYLNYIENSLEYLKAVPILVKKIFSHNNENKPEKWQLIKRFYLIDTKTGVNKSYEKNFYSDVNILRKYSTIKYLTDVRLEFQIQKDNKMSSPLLILEYDEVNSTVFQKNETEIFLKFKFSVIFKKSYSFGYLLEVGSIQIVNWVQLGEILIYRQSSCLYV